MKKTIYAIAALLAACPAIAQQAPAPESLPVQALPATTAEPATEKPATATQLEAVVVTAQKREQSLQKTPISLQAFDKKKLESLGIQGVADLASNVPALTVDPFPTNNAQLRLFIRGIGIIDAQVTQDAAVGVYIDGIYIARSAGLALDIADLARVEVLRGPQGTLYGRNATGGAINLITKRPQFAGFSTALSLSTGSRGNRLTKATANIPLSETLAVKLSAIGNRRQGFVENSGPGEDFGDHRDTGLRLDGRWRPRDWITADYAYDHSRLSNVNPFFQAVLPSNTTHGSADLFKSFAQSQSLYSEQRLDALASSTPFVASGTKVAGHAGILDFDLGDYDLKYIAAYRKLDDFTYADLGGGKGSPDYRIDTQAHSGPSATMAYGGPTPLQIPHVFQSQWSQELQWGGRLLDEQLQFIAGLYYFSESGGEDGRPLHHILNTVLDPASYPGLPIEARALISAASGTARAQLLSYRTYLFQIENEARAAYSQISYSPQYFDRRLHLTAGFRRSADRRRAVKDSVSMEYVEVGNQAVRLPPSQGNDTFVNVVAEKRFSDNSPSFNIQYEITPDATVYASSAKAYKSGGFNVRDPQKSAASGAASDRTTYGFGFIEGFAPERVHSYELGTKSEWFGRRLRLNADVFLTQYRDEQINFLIPGTVSDSKTRNAGKARIQGLELDATWLASPALILASNYALLDAKTEEVLDINGDNVASRYPFVSAPRTSYNASADWTFLKRGWGRLRGYLNYSYVGGRAGSASLRDYREGARIPGYGVLSGQLAATALKLGGKSLLDVTLWGKNLLDKEYVVIAIDNLPHADRAVVFGEPRSIGMNLVYRY